MDSFPRGSALPTYPRWTGLRALYETPLTRSGLVGMGSVRSMEPGLPVGFPEIRVIRSLVAVRDVATRS